MADLPPAVPPPVPPGYPPIWRDQRKIDAGHLRLLAIFHFVLAGMGVFFLGLLLMHYEVMNHLFADPNLWKNARNPQPPPPPELLAMVEWFYLIFMAWALSGMVLDVISGWCLARRKGRVFSLVVAALNCVRFPFGTVLGVFTLIVLLRESVSEAYAAPPS